MLNWIALYCVNMLLTRVKERTTPYTRVLATSNSSALIPNCGLDKLFAGNQYVTIGIFFAVLVAIGIWILLEKTKLGYELKATGLNKNAAKYCGMREKKNIILTMAIAGGLAGFGAGIFYLCGIEQWMVQESSVPAMGFNGIAAAFLGGLNPIGTIFSSYFIEHITSGGAYVDKSMYCAQISDLISAVKYAQAKKAFIVNFGRFEFSWFMLISFIILICSYIILYKTKFGLRLCACGEHPQAADSVGINVYKMRYADVLISGVLGGLGGLVYITAGVSEWKFENGVAGFGFLALAVMIFGQWTPIKIGLASLLFGLFRALSNVYTGFDALLALKLPSTVYNMLPYIISLVVLVFVSKNSKAPKAEGVPYDKGRR